MSRDKKDAEKKHGQLLLECISDLETKSLIAVERERRDLVQQKMLKKIEIAKLEREIKELEEKTKKLDAAEGAIIERVTSKVKLKIAGAKRELEP